MTKVNSLIKALEYCLTDDMHHDLCKDCPYNHYVACEIILMQDSLEIIKEYKNNMFEIKEAIWKLFNSPELQEEEEEDD